LAGSLQDSSGGGDTSAHSWPESLSSTVHARLSDARRYLRDKPDALLHSHRRQAALERLRALYPKSILFVCHGNICRSPFAAECFRSLLPQHVASRMKVESGGFVSPGRQAPTNALSAAARHGVDLFSHRSMLINPAALERADLVVVVSGDQARALAHRVRPGTCLIVLGDLDPEPIVQRTILDPWNGDAMAFEASYERIERCVRQLIDALRLTDD
jgi:protein-tyrosine-phosphatase